MIFRIGFDLDAAVKKAAKDWDGKYADQLEKAIQKRAIAVKLKLDTRNFDSLDNVKKRLAELKLEPITPETKGAIKQLAAELTTLAKALESVQKYSTRAGGTPEAVRNSRISVNEAKRQVELEKARVQAARAALAEGKLAQARNKSANAAVRSASATRSANNEYNTLSGTIERLARRMVAVYSIHQVTGFLTNVREVTAEFELQRVSLGAILQDQLKANQLFSQIKQFALKSPVKILDLTKYTKQLAAYKIGYDELFETTKRLTDVSVGLGVSMDRVVLAFGQVRATGYLRASEVRQFTEMGVPIVEELASKLSAMNGQLVTAADVMELISKRGISFEMVKEVFDDMTSAGGIFYNMQEKQGNTLYGMWQKLGDAASVMYEEIGNTEPVNKAMKGLIGLLSDLMRNWETVAKAMMSLGIAGAIFSIGKNAMKRGDAAVINKVTKATVARRMAQEKLNAAIQSGTIADTAAARAALQKAMADEKAAVAAQKSASAATKFVKGLQSIGKSILMGGLWGAAIAAITAIGTALLGVESNADKVKKKMSDIMSETNRLINTGTDNLIRLAERVAGVNVVDGSRDQKEALEELRRTYGNVIPQEELTIENLRRMRQGATDASEAYGTLTTTLENYIVAMQKQKSLDEIESIYGADLRSWKSNLTDNFEKFGFGTEESERFFAEMEKMFSQGTKKLKEKYGENFMGEVVIQSLKKSIGENSKLLGPLLTDLLSDFGTLRTESWMSKWTHGFLAMIDDIEATRKAYDQLSDSAKKFAEIQERISSKNENMVINYGSDFNNERVRANQNIKNIANEIKNSAEFKEAFAAAGVEIDEGWFKLINVLTDKMENSEIDFEAIFKSLEGKSAPELRNWLKELQKIYQGFVPANETVRQLRSAMYKITKSIDGLDISKVKQYIWDGSGEIDKHLKTVKDQIEAHKKNLYMLRETAAEQLLQEGFIDAALMGDIGELEKTIKAMELYSKKVEEYVDPSFTKDKGGKKSDDRLSKLQEILSTLEKINTKYEELRKKEGDVKALEDIQRMYANTLEYANKIAQSKPFAKFGLQFNMPTQFSTLQEYRKAILDIINTLKMQGYEKAALDLEEKIGTGDIDKLQNDIEKKLKTLTDRISRTKTAKEFYDKILSQTGDIELAANISMQLYGENGRELDTMVKEQFRKAFELLDKEGNASLAPEVSAIIDRGAYEELRDYISMLPEAQQKAAEDLVKEQQQMSAKQYESWRKDLQKAQDFANKRIELSRYTANQIAAIEERIAKLNPESADFASQKAMLEKMIEGYKQREQKEAAKIEYDMFKDMPIYVQMFDNLDNASTTMLTKMLDLLKKNKEKWGEFLDPTQLKEMQSRMNETEKQLAARNPFKTLSKSLKDWFALKKSGRTRSEDETKAVDAINAQTEAYEKWLEADKAYQAALKAHNNDTTNEDVVAAKQTADQAEDEYKSTKEAADAAQTQAEAWKEIADAIDKANDKIDEYQDQINKALDEVLDMMECFGADAIDMEFFNSMKEGFNQILDGSQAAVSAFAQFAAGDYFGGAMSSVSAITGIVSGISNLFTAGKIRKANKEIKRQQELLEQLEYTYSRLEKAADKAFGRDYINNFKQQQQVLQAQAKAYQKQAAAERSKGKKADKEKIKEFEQAYRDTMDEIADMQDNLMAQFTGTTKQDFARQLANSWIDARASLSDTFGAIEGDFKNMMKNMLVETMAAKIAENALSPLWDAVDKELKANDVNGAVDAYVNGMDQALKNANDGLEVWWQAMEARGYDMKNLLSDTDSEYTGIKRDIAGASEESMNNVAAIGNTLMYYVSPIPTISENVMAIRQLMEGGNYTPQTAGVDTTALWNRHLELQQGIYEHTLRSAQKCEAMAIKCAQIADDLHKVIVPRGKTGSYQVFVGMGANNKI